MAFNVSAETGNLQEVIGTYTKFATAMATMASGKADVTFPGLLIVHGVVGCAQGATGVGETVICTATSGNVASMETVNEAGSAAGTSVVMCLAWGVPKS